MEKLLISLQSTATTELDEAVHARISSRWAGCRDGNSEDCTAVVKELCQSSAQLSLPALREV